MKTATRLALGIFSCVVLAATAHGQEVPTLAQCKADRTAWQDPVLMHEYTEAFVKQAADGTPNRSTLNLLPLKELERRRHEMTLCEAYPEEHTSFKSALDWIEALISDRMWAFLRRHKMMDALYKEDAAGLR
jgi:hypothetical protein